MAHDERLRQEAQQGLLAEQARFALAKASASASRYLIADAAEDGERWGVEELRMRY